MAVGLVLVFLLLLMTGGVSAQDASRAGDAALGDRNPRPLFLIALHHFLPDVLKRQGVQRACELLRQAHGLVRDDWAGMVLRISLQETGAPSRIGLLGSFSRDTFLALARYCEANGIPFIMSAGCWDGPLVSLQTVRDVCDAAPRACVGFDLGEFLNGTWHDERQYAKRREWVRYADDLLALAQRYRKKVLWYEHSIWVRHLVFYGDLLAPLLDGRYADTLIICHEDNGHNHAINLGVILGLWYAGAANEWGASHQNWYWQDAQLGKIEAMPPELLERGFWVYHSLGASAFELESRNIVFEPPDANGRLKLSRQYREAVRPFLKRLRAGLHIPKRDEILSFSRVAIRLRAAPKLPRPPRHEWEPMMKLPFLYPFHERPDWRPFRRNPRCYLPSYAYNECYRYQSLIPETPHGVILIFPQHTKDEVLKGFEVIETDGTRVWLDGNEFDAESALDRVQTALRRAATQLPARADNAFLSVALDGERRGYKVYLVDPEEYRGPGRVTKLQLPDDGPVVDVVNGNVLTAPQCELAVPPGTSHRYVSLDVGKRVAERQREHCARNLKQIWLALRRYARDHQGRLPRSGKWMGQFEDGLNLHALFPRYVAEPGVLLCPSRGYDDWARIGACTSYCYRPGTHMLNDAPDKAIVADLLPGWVDELAAAHGGAGGYVLFVDGTVAWVPASPELARHRSDWPFLSRYHDLK